MLRSVKQFIEYILIFFFWGGEGVYLRDTTLGPLESTSTRWKIQDSEDPCIYSITVGTRKRI